MIVQFDTFELRLILANLMAANVKYDRGKTAGQGKVNNISMGSHLIDGNITGMDCSGFVRYVLYNGTRRALDLTGGSVKQRDALKDKKFEHFSGRLAKSIKDEYREEASKSDDQVRIGFRDTTTELQSDGSRKKTQVGHVWLVINGKTFESTKKSGNDGPASLNWNQRVQDVDDLFVLGSAPGFSAFRID